MKLAYCGSLGDSYDIELVIDALASMNDAPLFVIMGNGYKKARFEAYAKEKHVDAVFTGSLPYAQMCSLLSSCDIAINPITGKSAASIINKHADYAAAGIPVINTQDSIEYRELVKKYDMGVNCKNGCLKELTENLELLISDQNRMKTMGKNARNCAEECFDRVGNYQSIIKEFESD